MLEDFDYAMPITGLGQEKWTCTPVNQKDKVTSDLIYCMAVGIYAMADYGPVSSLLHVTPKLAELRIITPEMQRMVCWLEENFGDLNQVKLEFGGAIVGSDVNGINMNLRYPKMVEKVCQAAVSLKPTINEQKPFLHDSGYLVKKRMARLFNNEQKMLAELMEED